MVTFGVEGQAELAGCLGLLADLLEPFALWQAMGRSSNKWLEYSGGLFAAARICGTIVAAGHLLRFQVAQLECVPMIELSEQQKAEYFHRSYTAVDGLWFMKMEERYGFDAALDVDVEVWKVMPKIQARKLKSLTGLESGMEALCECFTTKLTIEGFDFQASRDDDGVTISMACCPWYDLLARSNRQHLAGKIGHCICDTEHAVWATEFGPGIVSEFGERICDGCSRCVVRFKPSR
jgi:hypothetical protein